MYDLLLHELIHVGTYTFLAFSMIIAFKPEKFPFKNLFLGLIVTIGMDADHLLDYFLYKGNFVLDLQEFLNSNYFESLGKTYVLFHAWEWVVLLLFIYLASKKRYSFILFIALGIFAQVLVDSLSYGFNWRVYFITYRLLNNFDQAIFKIL